MPNSDLKEFVDFIPGQLHEGKTWFVSYYVKNPSTQQLIRKRIKCNRIASITERRKFAKSIVLELNNKLQLGWNPFIEKDAPKGFYKLTETLNTYINVHKRLNKKGELRDDSIRSYVSFNNMFLEWLHENNKADIFVINFTKTMARDFLIQMDTDYTLYCFYFIIIMSRATCAPEGFFIFYR